MVPWVRPTVWRPRVSCKWYCSVHWSRKSTRICTRHSRRWMEKTQWNFCSWRSCHDERLSCPRWSKTRNFKWSVATWLIFNFGYEYRTFKKSDCSRWYQIWICCLPIFQKRSLDLCESRHKNTLQLKYKISTLWIVRRSIRILDSSHRKSLRKATWKLRDSKSR